jgi:hypothetical protein
MAVPVRSTPSRVIVLALLAGCERREPPTPDGSPSVAAAELPAPSPPPSSSLPAAPGNRVPSTPADASDPGDLPQTHDLPAGSDPALAARATGLWEAILRDEPERAMPFFFPRDAYRQVKDVQDPDADYARRLVAAYRHDVHALHARLGPGVDHAEFVALEVPEARARWIEPGEEWNKLGYFRVFGSKLRYRVDGQPQAFDVKSLISWRGQWYVVHLSAIK